MSFDEYIVAAVARSRLIIESCHRRAQSISDRQTRIAAVKARLIELRTLLDSLPK